MDNHNFNPDSSSWVPVKDSVNNSTSVSMSAVASATTAFPYRGNRLGAAAYNDSIADMYLRYGGTASATDFTVKLGGGDFWEMPQPPYAGTISVIWSSATGSGRFTEY